MLPSVNFTGTELSFSLLSLTRFLQLSKERYWKSYILPLRMDLKDLKHNVDLPNMLARLPGDPTHHLQITVKKEKSKVVFFRYLYLGM